MRVTLKRLPDQVIVITGASSGISLVTARMAARAGARVVLVARNEQALQEICADIRARGDDAMYVAADVGKPDEATRVVEATRRQYGGFDTWVNGAAAAAYARLDGMSIDDHRRLFDTNYWGVVYGTLAAVAHLRTRGGAIINIGSVLSDRAAPLQGAYSAAKHAVKAFTDTLRMELEKEQAPIAVTLIKPGSIDTPYIDHAQTELDTAPAYLPPVYAPDVVARAILHAAQHPTRDIVVGGGGRLISTFGMLFPRLTDRLMRLTAFGGQQSDRPANPRGNLYRSGDGGRERSGHPDTIVFEHSLYTRARLHPHATGAAALGLIGAALLLWRARGKRFRRV
jgi:NAD(P)-dependent dehydrogenase (short-subunit alcohol dehydrogenase family)